MRKQYKSDLFHWFVLRSPCMTSVPSVLLFSMTWLNFRIGIRYLIREVRNYQLLCSVLLHLLCIGYIQNTLSYMVFRCNICSLNHKWTCERFSLEFPQHYSFPASFYINTFFKIFFKNIFSCTNSFNSLSHATWFVSKSITWWCENFPLTGESIWRQIRKFSFIYL